MALLFTPQQLVGGQRYSSHTRLGNWLEDEDLKERQTTEFAERRARGGLAGGGVSCGYRYRVLTCPCNYVYRMRGFCSGVRELTRPPVHM